MKTIGIIDLETTSLDPTKGHVVEAALALFSVEHRCFIRARSWLIAAPPDEVAATQHIHGISPALVAARGVPFEEVCKQVHAIATKEVSVLCAHHAAFDRSWLPAFVQNVTPWFCTMDFEWPKPSTSRALIALALAQGVGVTRAHRALDDVMTLSAMFERSAELGADLPALITRALRPKVRVVADVPRSQNDTLKAHAFRWDPDRSQWWREMVREEVAALPFANDVRECA